MIFVTPVVALTADTYLMDRPLTLRILLGIVLVLTGILVAELPKYRRFWMERRLRYRR